MLETDKVFAGSIPENYDRYMVPLIFEPYAADIAQRAASLSPSAVLETAAGTGVVTRALAPKLSPGASYIVTDLNQPMLDYAASQQAPGSRIIWRQADALALPFTDKSFDGAVTTSIYDGTGKVSTTGWTFAKVGPAGHAVQDTWVLATSSSLTAPSTVSNSPAPLESRSHSRRTTSRWLAS